MYARGSIQACKCHNSTGNLIYMAFPVIAQRLPGSSLWGGRTWQVLTEMWFFLLGALALLLQSAVMDEPVPNYVVVLPARLSYPSMEKVCMDLSNVKSSVLLTISLETKVKTYQLLDRFIWKRTQLKCFSFPVPPPSEGTEEIATIHLSGRGGGSKIDEKKQVLIQRVSNGTFLQTDKPIYMPGQLVKFRIVTLNSSFIPLNEEYLLVELKCCPNSKRL